MSLKIRLSRGGTKKKPFYNVVVANSTSPRDGKFLKKIGYYNPIIAEDRTNDSGLCRFKLVGDNIEDLNKYISQGAIPSERVAKLLLKYYKLESMNKYIRTYTVKTKVDSIDKTEAKSS